MKLPRLYLGTMTFSWSQTSSRVDESVASEMLYLFIAQNKRFGVDLHHVDTARIYAGGKTEPVVGSIVAKVENDKILVGTKAHYSQTGAMSREGLQTQFQESLEKMKLSSVHEYYLHQPDPDNSLLESLTALHEMVSKGLITHIGMSNYHAHEMERAFALCEEHSLTPPKVYQGLYNPLNRVVEKELLSVLKKHNCSFVAFNPLAAGLLSGKHTNPDEAMTGRFKNNQNYLPRFYTPENFAAVAVIREACDSAGISMVEATYRWMLCHSGLGEDDGILLGASSVAQLKENLAACAAAHEKEALPTSILDAFEEAWKLTESQAFPYWRSYSLDMPNRDQLEQGASYKVSKK